MRFYCNLLPRYRKCFETYSKLTATIALRRFGKNGMRKRALLLTKLAFR